jgi:hypothetical protein
MPTWTAKQVEGGRTSADGKLVVEPTELDARQRARDAEIAARAAPFVDAFSNTNAVLAPGRLVAFVSTPAREHHRVPREVVSLRRRAHGPPASNVRAVPR